MRRALVAFRSERYLRIDNGRGQRSAVLDLRAERGRATLHALAVGADVFLQAYRPARLRRTDSGPTTSRARCRASSM